MTQQHPEKKMFFSQHCNAKQSTETTASLHTHFADLQWDESGMPCSTQFGDIYFCGQHGMAESQCVFLTANRLSERWQPWTHTSPAFTLGEIGFGTGLNFFMVWQLWEQIAPSHTQLHYVAVEQFPLKKSDLIRALQLWPALHPYGNAFIRAYPDDIRQYDKWTLTHNRLTLTLLLGDAHTCFQQYTPTPKVDAWFFDGFAPRKNPALWSEGLFKTLATHTKEGATFGTFSAASIVKQNLQSAGFSIVKVPGFGKKRHRLIGQYTPTPRHIPPSIAAPPSPLTPTTTAYTSRTAIVIGGGLAGVSTAYHLAEKGWKIQLFEQHTHLAQAASGHAQAILNHRFSLAPHSPTQQYKLASYQYAHALLTQCNDTTLWSPCGLIQLAYDDEIAQRQQCIIEKTGYPSTHVHPISARDATVYSGITLPHSGLYLPQSGWANLKKLCRKWAIHPRITLHTGSSIATCSWQPQIKKWALWDKQGHRVANTPQLIIANAQHATQFDPLCALPLRYNRGQVTFVPASPYTQALRTILRTTVSFTPAYQHQHCLGASFVRQDNNTALRQTEHASNVEKLALTLPHIHQTLRWPTQTPWKGHAAIRATSPDRLPFVGPVNPTHSVNPSLYVNIGHGSFGLSYCLLAAKLLADFIHCGDTTSPFWGLLSPTRFQEKEK